MAKVLEIQPAKEKPYRRATELVLSGEIDQAFELLDGILKEDPDDAQALSITAEVLKRAKKLPIAYTVAHRAAQLKPERPEVWATLGHCAQQLWRLDEAISCYRKAKQRAQTKHQLALYLNNIGSVYVDGGEFTKAEAPIREALTHAPDDTQARHNLGLCLLAQRKWREAWPYYSASVGTGVRLNTKYLNPPEPTWDGSKGKTVVIFGEQGLGDEICAASMVPDAMRDCRVILDCDARLAPLFRRSFGCTVHGTRTEKELNWPEADRKIDASISAFEIGKFYRNETADFPGTAYLKPCPDRSFMWKSLFASKRKPAIGIAWSGGTFHNAGMFRQLALSEWRPIFDAIDAHWVSLQYKPSGDLSGTPVVEYPHATLTKDYDDTAALVSALDLVICVQTSVGHLAGALGVPAWVMIPKTSQWRYGEDYRDLPWYSSVRLYRQGKDWPVQEIVGDLRRTFAHI